MSGLNRFRSMNVAEPEGRPVLVPPGNKARPVENRKMVMKPLKKSEKPAMEKETEDVAGLHRLSSMSASCSSDASSRDSSQSWASSSERAMARRRRIGPARRKQCGLKTEKSGSDRGEGDAIDSSLEAKRRCAWVTPNTEPCYAAFHDEEWGVPVHSDKKLFELLCLSGALSELTWPSILSKRDMFREAFLDFDPIAVSKLSEKKVASLEFPANCRLSELKLRGIIENARQLCKIIDEFGSFSKYIWNFVNQKPIVGQYRYPRQVPVKTPKAETISKDLLRRGFQGVGPTVIYSFMQVAGLKNDHLVGCFRFQECISAAESPEKNAGIGGGKVEEKKTEGVLELGLGSAMADLSF